MKSLASIFNDFIVTTATSAARRLNRFLEETTERVLKSISLVFAGALLLGAIWAILYYCFVARDIPDVKVEQIPAVLVLLATIGICFVLLLLGVLQGAGIYLGMALLSESLNLEPKEIRNAALQVFSLSFLCVATLGLVLLGKKWWLIGASALVVTFVSFLAIEAMSSKRARVWHGSRTIGQRVGGFIIALAAALYLVLFVAVGIVPASFDTFTPSNAAVIIIAIAGVSSFLNFLAAVTYRFRATFVAVLVLAIALVIVPLYGTTILKAPFRALHIGGFEAELALKSDVSEHPRFKRCFDHVNGVVRGYVLDDLGDTLLLATRDPDQQLQPEVKPTITPSPHPASSPPRQGPMKNGRATSSSRKRSSPQPEPLPSKTLKKPCIASLSKEHLDLLLTTDSDGGI